MQPYPNPNYFNQYPQFGGYNPMLNAQQRMMQLEQQYPQFAQQNQMYQQNMQGQQSQGVNGKIVPAAESITANDVPMDGSVAVFPKQDMSEIYAKSWNANGTIKTVVYRPIVDDGINNQPNAQNAKLGLSDEDMGVVMKRFDELAGEIEKLGKSIKTTGGRAKKEAEAKGDE